MNNINPTTKEVREKADEIVKAYYAVYDDDNKQFRPVAKMKYRQLILRCNEMAEMMNLRFWDLEEEQPVVFGILETGYIYIENVQKLILRTESNNAFDVSTI